MDVGDAPAGQKAGRLPRRPWAESQGHASLTDAPILAALSTEMPAAEPPERLVITFIDLFVLFHSSLSAVAGAGELQADCPGFAVFIYSPWARSR